MINTNELTKNLKTRDKIKREFVFLKMQFKCDLSDGSSFVVKFKINMLTGEPTINLSSKNCLFQFQN